jgi:predicted transcriptional regulator
MTRKEEAKQRAMLLKRLRKEHEETVSRTQALLREQKAIRRKICKPIKGEPKAIPAIAEMTGIEAEQVLWHITAMKKYGLVTETGMCGEYYLYQYVEDKKR